MDIMVEKKVKNNFCYHHGKLEAIIDYIPEVVKKIYCCYKDYCIGNANS